MNKLIFLFFLSMLLISTTGCASAGPWTGRVIDAETKQPIEGAAVVAVWYSSHIGSPGGPVEHFSFARETLTDKNGYFNMPVCRCIVIPFIREVHPPEFVIFKPGYGSYPHYQVSPRDSFPDHPLPDFDKKGVVVELPKFNINDRRYQLQDDDANSFSYIVQEYRRKVPMLFKLDNIERKNVGMEELKW